MYSYDFVFYKPGKKFYTFEEVMRLNNSLLRADFEVKGQWRMDKKEKEKIIDVDFDLKKSGQEFSLLLGPAEERFHGALGQLSIPEEEFEENPQKNAILMGEAASAIFLGLKPLFAWGDHELEIGKLEQFLRFDKIGALAWINLFSEELIERLGGIKNAFSLTSPEEEEENLKFLKEASFFPFQISNRPSEPVPAPIALECERRFPGAILRSFEIPSLKAIERLG
jgi:hypothetical protein